MILNTFSLIRHHLRQLMVQVMAWCFQATSLYLSQCWPWSLMPYVITRPQWVHWFPQRWDFAKYCGIASIDQIRKSKDYVYGIWVYKALDIWKGYYRVKKSLVSYVKPWTEAINNKYMKYHSKHTYQLSFWNVSPKVDYHAGGKWFIHGPKRRKENQLLSLKHSCWLSLV